MRLIIDLGIKVAKTKRPKNIYFCSSYDLQELKDVLLKCHQSDTIVLASSKSFETAEILKNLDYVKSWFGKQSDTNFSDHLYGISANVKAMLPRGASSKGWPWGTCCCDAILCVGGVWRRF